MDRKQNSSSAPSETNGKAPFLMLQGFPTPSNTEEEKLDLEWFAAVFRRRVGLIATVTIGFAVAGGGLLFLAASLVPPTYAGRFQLLVEPVTADAQATRNSTQAQQDGNLAAPDVRLDRVDYETQIRVLQSPKLMDPIVKQLQTRYPDITYEGLKTSVVIQRVTTLLNKNEQGTKLIEVKYEGSDPQRVQAVLDQLSQGYLRYSLKERQSSIRQGIKFIDGQLPQLKQRVDTLQRQIQALRQQYTLFDPTLQGQQLATGSNNLDQQQAANQTQIAEASSKRSTLQQQLQSANLQSVLGEAPYYQALQTQYQQVEGQLATESARLQPENPAMQALLEKRQKLRALLQQEATRVVSKAGDQITIAQARSQAIAQSQSNVDQNIRQLSTVARQYADLQRELEIATQSLNKFSARQEAFQIDAAQQEIPWELTIPPSLIRDKLGQPVNVDKIAKLQFLVLILIIGLLLGVGVGFLVETLQDVPQSIDEVKRFTKLPLLGSIPVENLGNATKPNGLKGLFASRQRIARNGAALNSGDSHIPLYGSTSFTEAFRTTYKNIRLLNGSDSSIRSLTISSAEPGDGKSTIAVNLAKAAAAMGQRVLLVDADLRHPQVHNLMNLPNEIGLSDVISSNMNVRSAIQPSAVRENLMVLTAGQVTVDPVELLSSGKLRLLMERFQMVFDLVIYDTPPLVGLADSSLIAAQTNGLAIVVRLGKTNRLTLTRALEELKISSTAVLGIVANGVQETALPYGYYYQPKVNQQNGATPVEL